MLPPCASAERRVELLAELQVELQVPPLRAAAELQMELQV